VGKLEEKRPLGRPRRRWEDSIKIIFKKCDGGGGILEVSIALPLLLKKLDSLPNSKFLGMFAKIAKSDY
jgi:hypothetical protein